jgi:hypothetical protein
MAVLDATRLTLADWAKRIDGDNKIPTVIELLSQTNEILTDCMFLEGNLPTGHRTVIRTGLPTVYWRAINQGIPNSKSTTAQVDEACGMMEARSEVDVALAKLNGNTAEFRASEDMAFLEAMNQAQASMMFYGNPATDPRHYLGLAPRYSSLSAGNGANILSAGGSEADRTSIYLVCWGELTAHAIFPKGSTAGLERQDLGEQTVYNADGTRLQALSTLYKWSNGLVVRDWRYVVRIANIDVSDLIAQTTTQAPTAATNIINLMSRALDRLPANMGRPCFYMNRTVYSGLRLAALNRSQNVLAIEQGLSQFGTPMSWTSFMGVPLRKSDAILNTEGAVA